MKSFIERQGDAKVADIVAQSNIDFNYGKDKMIVEEKVRLVEKFEHDLSVAEINTKIERSAALNKVRIQKMRKINEMVEALQHDALVRLHANLAANPDKYTVLIKDLLVQGLIKLIEPSVILRVRKSDLSIIQSQVDEAVSIYKKLMLAQVVAFKDRSDIPCRVTIDDKNFLPEWDEENQKNSCLGGFVMYAKKNRIVCSQTLDDRMGLVYAQAIPQIRAMLFPCLAKKEKKPVEHKTE